MRKLLHLFLAFILVSMTFAGGIKVNAEESDSIVGYWKLVEIAGEKNVMSREDLETYEQLGSVMYLKFRENGTVKFSLFGDEMEGWWNAYGITLEGTANQWAGPMTGADSETCGDIIIYTPTASGSAGSIRIWGIGRTDNG